MASYDAYERGSPRHGPRANGEEWDPRFDYMDMDSRGRLRDPADYSYHAERSYSPSAASPSQLVPRGRFDSNPASEKEPRDYLAIAQQDYNRRARSSEPGLAHRDFDYHHAVQTRYRGHPYDEYSDDGDLRHQRRYGRRVRRRDRRHDDDVRSEVGSSETFDHRGQKQQRSSGMSTQGKLLAAVAGAALLAGGKELYDRHEAKEERTDVQRDPLASAALAGFGALAAYEGARYYSKRQARMDRRTQRILERGRDASLWESSSDDEGYGSTEKQVHRNFLKEALEAAGLGATATATAKDKVSGTRSRGGSPSRSGSSDKEVVNKLQKVAAASLLSGAAEAFRVAKEPGGWQGEKTRRILTAAAGAATLDANYGANHGKLGLAEAVIGGLVGNRLLNGSRSNIEEDKATGRSRSRSRSRSQSRAGGSGAASIAALAAAGLNALNSKQSANRSKSRGRSGRGRVETRSSSRDERSRSRSIVDKARDGLAKLGLGGGAGGSADEQRRRDSQDSHDGGTRHSHTHRRHDRHGREQRQGLAEYDSDSDLVDSEDERPPKREHRRH